MKVKCGCFVKLIGKKYITVPLFLHSYFLLQKGHGKKCVCSTAVVSMKAFARDAARAACAFATPSDFTKSIRKADLREASISAGSVSLHNHLWFLFVF